ncbi:MAG: hypothetical protein QOI22_1088, partial [Verrucomicrobiota bacterium]
FAVPITGVTGATVIPGPGGTASIAGSPSIAGTEVTVNLTNVSNAQTLSVNLIGVNDGTALHDVSIPMGVLLGDVNATRRVDSADVFNVRQTTLQDATSTNFRMDVNASGRIDSSDVFIVRQQTLTGLK